MGTTKRRLITFATGALVGLSLLAYLLWSGYQEAMRTGEASTRSYAAILETRLDSTLRRIEGDIRDIAPRIAALPQGRQPTAREVAQIDSILDLHQADFPEITGMRFFDANGELQYTSNRKATTNANISDRTHFRAARDGPANRLIVSAVLAARTTGEETVVLGKALRDAQGRFRGMLTATLDVRYFQNMFASLNLGEDSVITIFRSDTATRVMRWPASDNTVNDPLPKNSLVRLALAEGTKAGTSQVRSTTDGLTRVTSFRVLESYPFVITVGISQDSVLAGWWTRTRAVVFVLLAALGLLFLFWRSETSRMQAIGQSAEHERGFYTLAEACPLPLAINDAHGNITFLNKAFVKTIGYSNTDILTLDDWWPVAYPDPKYREWVAVTWKQNMERSVRSGNLFSPLEVDIQCKDNLIRTFLVSAATLTQGLAGSHLVILQDITEAKRSEKAIQEVELRTRRLLKASQIGLWDWNIITNEVYFSPEWKQQLGYEDHEIPNQFEQWQKRVHPEDLEPTLTAVKDFADGRRPSYDRQVRMRHRDGSWRWFQSDADCLRNDSGEPIRMMGSLVDITDRKRLENFQEMLAAIVESSNDAIYSRSMDGTILTWNAAAETMFGYPAVEIIGKKNKILLPPSHAPLLEKNNDALRKGAMVKTEAQRVTKHGQLIDVSGSHSAIRDGNGNIVAVSTIFQDISQRKRAEADRAALEEQLRESQKMQAIGTLAGGIAHDFNNILAVILGNTELMRQDSAANPAALESLEEIAKASRRGRDLVQQILAFSRRQPAERKPMALAPIVEESARLLRSTLPASVMLQTQCGADVPEVLASATQIEQVIINLATNAMQALGGARGRIDISLDTVFLDEALTQASPALHAMRENHPGRAVRLAVKDNGPGMEADTLSRIFEPFFTTKAVNEGTGLGLSVVHGIVLSHQGVIVAQSEPGKGATFTIYLPLAPAQTAAEIADASGTQIGAASELNLGGSQHVLYLDDDNFLVSLVKRLLERRGLRVSGYLDPGEALAALRANPASVDLVVSDYNMPLMSGLEFAREVRTIRADLPVVVASGFVDEALQTQAKAAGVREVIFKAEALESLCEVVARVLSEVGNKSKSS